MCCEHEERGGVKQVREEFENEQCVKLTWWSGEKCLVSTAEMIPPHRHSILSTQG